MGASYGSAAGPEGRQPNATMSALAKSSVSRLSSWPSCTWRVRILAIYQSRALLRSPMGGSKPGGSIRPAAPHATPASVTVTVITMWRTASWCCLSVCCRPTSPSFVEDQRRRLLTRLRQSDREGRRGFAQRRRHVRIADAARLKHVDVIAVQRAPRVNLETILRFPGAARAAARRCFIDDRVSGCLSRNIRRERRQAELFVAVRAECDVAGSRRVV